MSRKNWFLFIFVGFVWGIPYLLMKNAVHEVSPYIIVFSRTIIGSAILIPIALRRGTLGQAFGKNFKFVILYAIGEMVFPWIFITSAEKKITSGLAGLLVATVPIWSSILASLRGDKSVWHAKRLAGMLLGFVGVGLVVGIESFRGHQDSLSIAIVILAAICYASAVTMLTAKLPGVDGVAVNGVAMLFTALLYTPFSLTHLPAHIPSTKALLSLLVLGLLPTALAFYLFFILLYDIGPARASLVTYLNTAFAVLLGIIFLNEKVTTGIVLGLPLVLIGSYFASKKSEARVKKVTQ